MCEEKPLKQIIEERLESFKQPGISDKQFKIYGKAQFEEEMPENFQSEVLPKMKQYTEAKKLLLETELARIESGLLYDFSSALQAKDVKKLGKMITPKGTKLTPTSMTTTKFNEVDGIKWSVVELKESDAKELTPAQYRSEIKKYLADFKTISFAQAKVLNPNSALKNVDVKSLKSMAINVSFDLRGFDKNNNPIQKRSRQIVSLERTENQAEWTIAGMSVVSHDHLIQTRQPAFARAKANAGFDAGKVYPRLEALRRGGYAFAVGDYNGDGHLDAFVGNYGASTLWEGQKDGTFKELSSVVNNVTLAKAAAFADFDNDGKLDLVITRFASDTFTGDVLVFKNKENKFEEVIGAFPSKILREYAMPMAIADYNNDGLLDIYIGFPGERDFSMSAYQESGSDRKVVHGVFYNRNSFKFSDVTEDLIPPPIRKDLFPHGAVATDYNHDNQMDIIIMDDQKSMSPVLRNNGKGGFKMVNQEIAVSNTGYGMGVASGDINGDGQTDILMSNATFNSQRRLDSLDAHDSPRRLSNGTLMGLRFFQSMGDGTFVDRTLAAELMDTGEGAGGVTLIDYDNDGLLDIYLVNGLWSGSSKKHNIDSLFAQAQETKLTSMDHLQAGLGERKRGKTQSTYMQILMQEKVKEGSKVESLSFAGHQPNRLFKNLGNGKFLEVGHLEGIASISDGYMSVVADINKDGRADLLLRNCDPGSELAPFPVVESFINNHQSKNSLWLSFKGSKSNKMGVGVKVVAEVGNHKIYREVQANNSAVQGEVVAHIGLDGATAADRITITWPSGLQETVKDVKAGRHTFTENRSSVAQN